MLLDQFKVSDKCTPKLTIDQITQGLLAACSIQLFQEMLSDKSIIKRV